MDDEVKELTNQIENLKDELSESQYNYDQLYSEYLTILDYYESLQKTYKKILKLSSRGDVCVDDLNEAISIGAVILKFTCDGELINLLEKISDLSDKLNIPKHINETYKQLEKLKESDWLKYKEYQDMLNSIYPIQITLEIDYNDIRITSVKGDFKFIPLINGLIKCESLNKI